MHRIPIDLPVVKIHPETLTPGAAVAQRPVRAVATGDESEILVGNADEGFNITTAARTSIASLEVRQSLNKILTLEQ